VQGVGFRPFVYRLASVYDLKGRVDNRTSGVLIRIDGEEEQVKKFCAHILRSPPPAAQIKSIDIINTGTAGYSEFSIAQSTGEEGEITEISPDIAVCPECIEDLVSDPLRISYPFTNCTNCGPRFTIVEDLPYDRVKTSMHAFDMCPACREEYSDILDRRFHAQPVACSLCGPSYIMEGENESITGIEEIVETAASEIMSGKTVAIKGLGGFHLVCNALDEQAVGKLREKKQRDARPFAVMFRDILAAEEYCHINTSEYHELTSWRRPIVILKERKPLAPSVSGGLGTTGTLLPYMPLHYLLFSRLTLPAVVMTSGNISEEPLIRDNDEAREKLMPVAGSLLTHDREIINRADDSVERICNGKVSLIRRSRGYVPSPVDLTFKAEGILAAGGELKNTFCIGRGNQALLSQHIGDLKNDAAWQFYLEAIERFRKMFRFEPKSIACDLHPDYLPSVHSARLSSELGIPLIKVQHHYAHIASCMAEHGLDEDVIGVSMDGTGYGTDGNIWGSEFIFAGVKEFERYAHFDYVSMPGGDRAADEPWRMAVSYLYKYFGKSGAYDSFSCIEDREPDEINLVLEMIDRGINSPLSSGAGRLFDAVSAMLGLCTVSAFDSEAPIRLESAALPGIGEHYPYEAGKILVFAETLRAIMEDAEKKTAPGVISAKFHNTVAEAINNVCGMMRRESNIRKVLLSGGVFQNKYLLERVSSLLSLSKFEVYTNHKVPANDGGLSLGQLYAASGRS
jgi:hydrogenase maturation protein HypF